MRYMGGKWRIAKELVAVMKPAGRWFEPFCGGLGVTRRLAASGFSGVASDACAPLIALYRAVAAGWQPPHELSEAEYAAARALPDDSPLRAFAGFGCSYGGKWFGGYARPAASRSGNGKLYSVAAGTARGLTSDIAAISAAEVRLHCAPFEASRPQPGYDLVYCDPPYAGTTSYAGAPTLDSAAFWTHAQAWARAGARVFVSEYACPVPNELAHELRRGSYLGRGVSRSNAGSVSARVERLFRVLP